MIGGRILLTYPLLGLCNILRIQKSHKKCPLGGTGARLRSEGKEEEGQGGKDPEREGDDFIKTPIIHMVAF